MEECIKFSLEYGFMSQEEAEDALKMLEAGLTGGPGGCQGKEKCDAFCNDLANMKECIEFSVKAGFMTSEEAEQALKMAELGIIGGPGGCQGEEECRAFCDNPDNMEVCLDFAVKIGDMTLEEKEQILKGGPGGCRGQECETYCDDPAHSKECIEYAVEQGFITPEEAEAMMAPPPPGEMPPKEKEMPPPEGEMPPPEEKMPPKEEMKPLESIQAIPVPERLIRIITDLILNFLR